MDEVNPVATNAQRHTQQPQINTLTLWSLSINGSGGRGGSGGGETAE